MKIAPYTKKWNEGERDWSFVENPAKAISNWEQTYNITLPDDYRSFMLKYNGGRVFPRLFKHQMGSLQAGPLVDESGETYIGLVLPWSLVESHWQGETYGKGLPPDHLLIADTPGGIQILMNVGTEDKGITSSWYHSSSDWGADNNNKIFRLAGSFAEFLGKLYQDEDGEDYHNWYLPIYDKLAKDLEIQ